MIIISKTLYLFSLIYLFMKNFSINKLTLFLLVFCGTFLYKAQNEIMPQLAPMPGDAIVFGKKYTKEELKESMGVIRCASTEYEQWLQQQDPKRMTDAEFEAWLAPLMANSQKSQSGGVITIPVVVHVIHSGQNVGVAPNISDAQVQSQITVMSQDFRKMAGTPGFNTNPVGADTMIQFALAKVDPNGNPTNGINRVNLCLDMWTTAQINSIVKPTTIWDPTQYMNMWSVRFFRTDLLGYAQFPTGSTLPMPPTGGATTDGVVAGFNYFGSSDLGTGFTLSAPYNKGRTMTHEVGHFLGLRHIWGDSYCGNDFVNDTPVHETANYNCPSHPKPNNCGTADEMFENYMDYTQDNCMNIYTAGQAQRMATVMNNSPRRVELKTSVKDQPIPLFPNDAELKVLSACNSCIDGFQMKITNRGTAPLTSATITYTIGGGAAQTFNWTGNLTQDQENIFVVPVASGTAPAPVTANIMNVNGTTDQRTSNNNASGNYTATPLAPNYNFTQVKFTLQRDNKGSETRWTLKNGSNQIIQAGGPYADGTAAPLTLTWNLPQNQCYTFTIYDSGPDNGSGGNGLCCINGNGSYSLTDSSGSVVIKSSNGQFTDYESTSFRIMAQMATNEVGEQQAFSVYPNPAGDVLNVTNLNNKNEYTIHNTAGQIVMKGSIKDSKLNVSSLTTGNYVITVKQDGQSNSVKFIKK